MKLAEKRSAMEIEAPPVEDHFRPAAAVRFGAPSVGFRLAAAGQVSPANDRCCRNLPFIISPAV